MEQSSAAMLCCKSLIPWHLPLLSQRLGFSRRKLGSSCSHRGCADRVTVRASQDAAQPSLPSCHSQKADIISSDAATLASLPPSLGRRRLLVCGGQAGMAFSALNAAAANSAAVRQDSAGIAAPNTTVTDRVFLDLSLCPSSSFSSLCGKELDPLGRVVIGLYGKQVPQTARNFKAMCTGDAGSSYRGTAFHRVIQGQFIEAGRQGKRERGEVGLPTNLNKNLETLNPNSFKLRHIRPGTVSLCLAENDDEDAVRLRTDYRNVEFLITTGPGPVPQLDNGNIVFGTILEGMDLVATVSALPTYKPGEGIRQFNEIAELLGDDRAANARSVWDRPLNAVVISKCGELRPFS